MSLEYMIWYIETQCLVYLVLKWMLLHDHNITQFPPTLSFPFKKKLPKLSASISLLQTESVHTGPLKITLAVVTCVLFVPMDMY